MTSSGRIVHMMAILACFFENDFIICFNLVIINEGKRFYNHTAFLSCDFWHYIDKCASMLLQHVYCSNAFMDWPLAVKILFMVYHDHHATYWMKSQPLNMCTKSWWWSQEVVILVNFRGAWFELPVAIDCKLKVDSYFNSWWNR